MNVVGGGLSQTRNRNSLEFYVTSLRAVTRLVFETLEKGRGTRKSKECGYFPFRNQRPRNKPAYLSRFLNFPTRSEMSNFRNRNWSISFPNKMGQ